VAPASERDEKGKVGTDKDYLCRAIVIGWKGQIDERQMGGAREGDRQTLWVANKMSRRARK
jgi:hypothetical protein